MLSLRRCVTARYNMVRSRFGQPRAGPKGASRTDRAPNRHVLPCPLRLLAAPPALAKFAKQPLNSQPSEMRISSMKKVSRQAILFE